jgi:hypothetical protein
MHINGEVIASKAKQSSRINLVTLGGCFVAALIAMTVDAIGVSDDGADLQSVPGRF